MVNVMSAKWLSLNLNWLPVNETIEGALLDIYSIYLKCFNILDRESYSIKIISLS